MEEKKQQIKEIYNTFETETGEYRKEATCKKGCSYCCTDAGNIDLTTLEGLIIREKIRLGINRNQCGFRPLRFCVKVF